MDVKDVGDSVVWADMPAKGDQEPAEGHQLTMGEEKTDKSDDVIGSSQPLNIKELRGALEKMMTCSNIFRKNDPLYNPALKVRLYNPAGKAKDFLLHHHAILSDKGCPLPPKIHITDFWVHPSV